METIANAIVSLFELFEAEGRTLRQETVDTAEGIIIVLFGALLFFLGVAALMAAFYLWLSSFIGRPAAATAVGIVLAASGSVLLYSGHKHSRGGGGSAE